MLLSKDTLFSCEYLKIVGSYGRRPSLLDLGGGLVKVDMYVVRISYILFRKRHATP